MSTFDQWEKDRTPTPSPPLPRDQTATSTLVRKRAGAFAKEWNPDMSPSDD